MMKFELKNVDHLLAEMESILGRVRKINSDFKAALDAKDSKCAKKAA
jgi:hypothetical protein